MFLPPSPCHRNRSRNGKDASKSGASPLEVSCGFDLKIKTTAPARKAARTRRRKEGLRSNFEGRRGEESGEEGEEAEWERRESEWERRESEGERRESEGEGDERGAECDLKNGSKEDASTERRETKRTTQAFRACISLPSVVLFCVCVWFVVCSLWDSVSECLRMGWGGGVWRGAHLSNA